METVGKTQKKQLHVLIAEDNELNAEILTEILQNEGISSTVAENGQQALEFSRTQSPGILMRF